MSGAPVPQVLLEAIASDASAGQVTSPMPEAPTGTNAASIQGGYPPIVLLNILAGGEPPLGQDANGYNFLLSSHTLWVESGQLYGFNSDLSTANSGYKLGALVISSDDRTIWSNQVDGNTSNPDTGSDVSWIPLFTYGGLPLSGLTGGTITLTPQQWRHNTIILVGVLTSNLVIILPAALLEFRIVNQTSGAFITTVKTQSGSGVVIPQGGFANPVSVYSDGVNYYPTVSPLGVPIDQAATALTLAERNNVGQIFATAFNASITVDNLAIVNVWYDSGDGYSRRMAVSNFEAQLQLANINGQVTGAQIQAGVTLTGVPKAPTAAGGTSTTQIATTAFANPGSLLTGGGPWWERRASGALEQWGSVHIGDVVAPTIGNVAFTVSFATIQQIQVSIVDQNATGATVIADVTAPSNGGFTWEVREVSSAVQNIFLQWRAIGV
jgi:hypothetical protein